MTHITRVAALVLLPWLPLSPGLAHAQTDSPSVSNSETSSALLELRRVFRDASVNALTFHNIDGIFPTQTVAASGRSRSLPTRLVPLQVSYGFKGKAVTGEEALERTHTNALLVIKDGAIVYERYRNLTNDQTRFLSMSMAKSITSMLIGIAVHDGAIRSLDQPLTDYIPELKGSAYDGVTIRDTLEMKTGVDRSDAAQMTPGTPGAVNREQIFVRNTRPAVDEAFLIKRKEEPGRRFDYSTLNTTMLGWLLERATKQSITAYTSERLWKPLGAEASAYWMVDGPGASARPLNGMGLNAVLRDYGRLGLMMMNGGRAADGTQVVPAAWVEESTGGDHAPTTPGASRGYRYQWWTVPNSKAYMAVGLQGQYIFVDPATKTVVVKLSYFPPTPSDASAETDVLLKALSEWPAR